jgi:U6 snRNA-associated Sm-like protein LSm6
MNIAMEQTEEFVNGQLKNKYGDCFIRGNNGTFSSVLVVKHFPTFPS